MNKGSKSVHWLGFLSVIAVTGVSGVHAQTVANGNFESPRIAGYLYHATGGSWTFDGGEGHHPPDFDGGTGVTSAGSAFTAANPGDTTQVAFLQGPSGNYFYQSVDFLKPGDYTVSFSAAQRGHGSSSHAGMDHQDFCVLINGAIVGTYYPTSVNYTTFTTYPFSLTAPGAVTLEFRGIDSAGDDETVFIDNVSITQAPYQRRHPL